MADLPFAPVDANPHLPTLETETMARWRGDGLFEASLAARRGSPQWVFYEGPPTANGKPGTHHVWARVFKDLYPRFQTMRGKYVARKGGWDCHGLPVEIEVERELGFGGKHDIEAYGIAEFNAKCRESVGRYVGDWAALTERIGMWIDTDDAYWTLTNAYVESVWWLFSQMWDKGLVYEGFKVVPYCGRCGTALSAHEVAQGYRDVTEDSLYVRFPVVGEDYDLCVWTTTPWTLVSNVGAAVGPAIDYVRVESPDGGRDLVLAAARVAAVLGEGAKVVARVKVDELVGRHYERPFTFLPIDHTGNRIVAADFVTLDDGSGIVHIAPAFGEVDREVSDAHGLPALNPVDGAARFDASVAAYEGQFVKDADEAIIADLEGAGRLVKIEPYTHSYPHCWRCSTPLVYWGKPTWFARTSSRRDEMLAQNETVGWHPETIKHGRFGEWLRNNVDWALSRDRYWGSPIPVWRCTDCGHDECIGSVPDLATRSGRDLSDLDLHRPYVDEITIPCAQCGGEARRVASVLDAWFDSGSMPSAQFHHPFENEETFQARFPADFICEAIDQTRGWFYSLLAVNTLVFDETPYRNVVCLGHIVDKDGQKMSKSKGNVIDPWTILDSKGADALRWYFLASGSPWSPRRVFMEGIDETTRRFLLTLWNTYYFFVTYANLDHWEPGDSDPRDSEHVLDRWVRSRLHSTIIEVTDALEGFDALRGAQALESLVDDLSNWFVRRSRPRVWNSDTSAQANAALHECLTTISLLLAPYCPFTADVMYRNLTGAQSVHLADWPEPQRDAIDVLLEQEMATARTLTSLGRAARTDAKIKVRQPLARALVFAPGAAPISEAVAREIADELNVKHIEAISSLEGLLDYAIVPNFKVLGPRVGRLMPKVKAALEAVNGDLVRRAFDRGEDFEITVEGTGLSIGPDDVELRATRHGELALAEEGGYAVALDLTVDEDLRREGLARELVRALNEHRKAIGLEIADRISLTLVAGGEMARVAREYDERIAADVLATHLAVKDDEPTGELLMIDGHEVGVRMQRVTP